MKSGGGSELMKNREKTLNIIKKLSGSLKYLPFSIKARTGINTLDKPAQKAFLIEASKYCSKISIHGRTLKELYGGEVDWDWIAEVDSACHCPVI